MNKIFSHTNIELDYARFLIQLLQLKNSNPQKYEQDVAILAYNLQSYPEKSLEEMRRICSLASTCVPEKWNLEENEMLALLSRCYVNTFSILKVVGRVEGKVREESGFGLYSKASFFNHSCDSNASYFFDHDVNLHIV